MVKLRIVYIIDSDVRVAEYDDLKPIMATIAIGLALSIVPGRVLPAYDGDGGNYTITCSKISPADEASLLGAMALIPR